MAALTADSAALALTSTPAADPAEAAYAKKLYDAVGEDPSGSSSFSSPIIPSPLACAALAVFLTDVEGNHDKAQHYFELAWDQWEDIPSAAPPPPTTEGKNESSKSHPPTSWCDATCFYVGCYADFLANIRGDPAKAVELHRRVLAARPNDPQSLGNLAMVLHRGLKAYDEAEAMYEKALAKWPSHASVAVKYGNFRKHVRRDAAGAAALYRRALESNPEHADALGNLAVLLHSSGEDPDQTEELYRRAVTSDPEGVNNIGNLALFLSDVRRNYAAAEEMYKLALAANPKHANSLYNYALMVDGAYKDHDRAEALYREAIAADPRHGFSHYNLAILLEEVKGDLDGAEESFTKAVDINPTDPVTLEDFGLFYWRARSDPAKAAGLFRRAIESEGRRAPPRLLCLLADLMSGEALRRARHRRSHARHQKRTGRPGSGGRGDATNSSSSSSSSNSSEKEVPGTVPEQAAEAEALYRRALKEESLHLGALVGLAALLGGCSAALTDSATTTGDNGKSGGGGGEGGRGGGRRGSKQQQKRRPQELHDEAEKLFRRAFDVQAQQPPPGPPSSQQGGGSPSRRDHQQQADDEARFLAPRLHVAHARFLSEVRGAHPAAAQTFDKVFSQFAAAAGGQKGGPPGAAAMLLGGPIHGPAGGLGIDFLADYAELLFVQNKDKKGARLIVQRALDLEPSHRGARELATELGMAAAE
eukprot:g3396.t1